MSKIAGRAHIYCRVSSTAQEDGYSLETQERACREFAMQRGVAIASVAREVWSGGDRHRPELDALLDRLEPDDVVIAYALDRLSRDQIDTAILIDRIEGVRASLALVTEDFEKSATGTFLRNAKAFAAELELEKIRERTQRGRRGRIAQGKPLVSPRPPYGYLWNDDKSRYVLDPLTAPVVRDIFDWALTGVSLRGICTRLEERGIPSSTGNPKWTAAVIREVLLRPVYSGDAVAYAMRWERQPGGGYRKRPGALEEQIKIPNVAEPIVTADEQHAAQARLETNKQNATRNNRDPEATLLRAGFIRCGHCGWVMGVKNTPPCEPGRSPQYRCNARNMRGHDCPQTRISASVIDGPVWERVVEVLRNPGVIMAEVERRRQDGDLEHDLAALDKLIATTAEKQARLARRVAAIDDDDAAAPLLAELRALAATKAATQQRRDGLERTIADREDENARVQSLAEWCAKVNANLETLTYEERRLALTWLGVDVRVFRREARDENGQQMPRWTMTMAPLTPDSAVVFGSSH